MGCVGDRWGEILFGCWEVHGGLQGFTCTSKPPKASLRADASKSLLAPGNPRTPQERQTPTQWHLPIKSNSSCSSSVFFSKLNFCRASSEAILGTPTYVSACYIDKFVFVSPAKQFRYTTRKYVSACSIDDLFSYLRPGNFRRTKI